MTPHPADLPVAEIGTLLRRGDITCVAVAHAHLDRIAARDPAIGAFVHVARDAALDAARAADDALARGADLGALHGIPFAIKDIFDVAGWPVRWGSRIHAARIAETTAPAVQSLLDAGAVPLGLVATYELATVGPDAASLYPQPRNPHDPGRITGGSSSGSAAAVAAGMVRIALGTDTGGSIRSPASYCGITGLKPTRGAVPLGATMPLAPSLDHAGPIAATVAEAVTMFATLTGTAPSPSPSPGLGGLHIAYGRGWADDPDVHPDLLALLDTAASTLSLLGARIAPHDLPDYAAIERAATSIILAEGYASHGAVIRAAPGDCGPMARDSILSGAAIPAAALSAARDHGRDFGERLDAVLSGHDALILPVTLAPAPAFGTVADAGRVWTPMRTIPFNVTGHPALSLPMGLADGLPMGLQIVGRHGDEATLLRIGAAFEAATPPIPPAFATDWACRGRDVAPVDGR